MARWMMLFVVGVALVVAGCKSQEEKVKVYEKSSEPTAQGKPGDSQGQAGNMSEAINSNPNIPDAAKKAMGTK